MQKPYSCLWFDGNAAEAVEFYTSVVPNSRTLSTSYYGENMHMPAGAVLTIVFELNGTKFMALNAGPEFKFNEAISICVPCDSQAEIDELYSKLSAVPESEICGWLKDKYGLSWQIAPSFVEELLGRGDQAKCNAMMQAVMKMKKLDLAAMKAAYDAG